MIFIGDVHGKITTYREILHNIGYQKKSLQLGDMGLGFPGVYLHAGGVMEKGNHMFIRGNHDNPQVCQRHPRYKGDYGYDAEETLFYMSGGWSIDWEYRTPGKTWWSTEELSYESLNNAYNLYIQSKPRIVATHEPPKLIAIQMLGMQPGVHHPCPVDADLPIIKEEYQAYKHQLGYHMTRTGEALQRMFEEHQPEHWVFGHWHVTTDLTIAGTEFHCLGELIKKEIILDSSVPDSTGDSTGPANGVEAIGQ